MNRSVTRRIGATTPITEVLGIAPIKKVATAMSSRQVTTAGLRPYLSPKCPATNPPIGRATNPAQNVLNESSVPISAEESGKNTCGKTSAAAVPYKKKSYHSMELPSSPAPRSLRCARFFFRS